MKELLRAHTPDLFWNILRSGKRMVMDTIATVTRRPPRDLLISVGGDSPERSEQFVAYCKNHAALKPDDKVLEVGCGVGRVTIPLTKYLSKSGSYAGFDIVNRSIKWCSRTITPRYPNFVFHHADIYNKFYNRGGRLRVIDFFFPYADETFDFIILRSVFTHMLPRDVKHYFSEISRVLKPDGRCLITWFLLNETSTQHINRGASSLPFVHPFDGCMTIDADVPETAIAYREADVVELYAQQALRLSQPIHYGSWCRSERSEGNYQDYCIAQKSKSRR
jgi:SAM-dependent methyltransferase